MDKPMKILPFGKYKGQPVEVLEQDQQYRDWLLAQPWFRERFQLIHTYIVNNFGAPAETPEHNALQARFLDESFRNALGELLFDSANRRVDVTDLVNKEIAEIRDKLTALLVSRETLPRPFVSREYNDRTMAELTADIAALTSRADPLQAWLACPIVRLDSYVWFEREGRDVDIAWRWMPTFVERDPNGESRWYLTCGRDVGCELKPTIGDDYPAILRQMRASNAAVLVIGEYQGTGATEQQMRAIFRASGIRVVFVSEIDARAH